jgi:hypothetical protein
MAAEHRPALATEAEVAHPTEPLVLATERPHAGLIVMSISERVLRCERRPLLVIH